MRSIAYNIKELKALAKLDRWVFLGQIKKKTVDSNLRLRRLIQESLAYHRAGIEFGYQLELIDKQMIIERYFRPHLTKKARQMLKQNHPLYPDQKIESMTRDKVEKTIRKFSY